MFLTVFVVGPNRNTFYTPRSTLMFGRLKLIVYSRALFQNKIKALPTSNAE